MVCTANELSAWNDFPKGLRVLLLDEDSDSAAEIKANLESMDYIVSMFCNVNEALSAVSGNHESFHVAILEVSSSNSDESFKFLETAKELPTIMTSNLHCLSTMMKCIALGAVEFVRKPLSEDKLRNIWQHVVHKAFNAGGSAISESLRPVKDSVASMIQREVTCENDAVKNIENMDCGDDLRHSPANNKYPAPSTPQLEQGIRQLDDGDCQDHTNYSSEKESGDQEGESKSVENTCRIDEVTVDEGHRQSSADKVVIKKENEVTDRVKKEDNRLHPPKGVNRKKLKVDWTSDLHKKFVQAVEQLGVDQAIPSRILELMKVKGLTRHNVASHLQKYRMHKRNILPKLDDGRWQRLKDNAHSNYYLQRPIMAYPPSYHPGHGFCQGGPVYPMWGAVGTPQFGPPMWGPTSYHPWTPTDSWHWMIHPGVHADAWGCPVVPPPGGHFSTSPQAPPENQVLGDEQYPQDSFSLQEEEEEEEIDKVMKEAMNKPWLPLPLGLKPPSTDTVLAELSRQGISPVPPLHDQRL